MRCLVRHLGFTKVHTLIISFFKKFELLCLSVETYGLIFLFAEVSFLTSDGTMSMHSWMTLFLSHVSIRKSICFWGDSEFTMLLLTSLLFIVIWLKVFGPQRHVIVEYNWKLFELLFKVNQLSFRWRILDWHYIFHILMMLGFRIL